MSKKTINFNAGPAILPDEVLAEIQRDLLDYNSTGMSVLEISHRSLEYEEINDNASKLLLEFMGLGENYKVAFMGGGASTQFALVPMNFLHEGKTAAYVDTGAWAAKAAKEASLIGESEIVASSKDTNYDQIPDLSNLTLSGNTAYLHLTSNNTIFGTQYHTFPEAGKTPIVCDMSSDILCRDMDYSRFSMIFAGAQKNMGPAGATVVVIKDDFLKTARSDQPVILSHKTHVEKKSLFNTPPVFAVYTIGLVLKWIQNNGGLKAVEKRNIAKKERIYQLIDLYPDYFVGTVQHASRSWMNITLRLQSEELEKRFIAEAKEAGMVGLKGHRSVGGIRVSIYNAMPLEGVEQLADFMEAFRKKNS